MKQPSQPNRSTLLMAGEKSLRSIELEGRNYYTTNETKQKQRPNEILYESTVRQVYKRPGYQGEIELQNNFSENKSIPAQFRSPKVSLQLKKSPFELQQYSTNQPVDNYDYLKMKPVQSLLIAENQSKMRQQITIGSNKNISKNRSYSLYKVDNQRIKKIMIKLTYTRLRKMQALVRGFLVRRKVYPKLLEEYLISKAVLGLIQANVVYREISTIIMQTITFPKYEDQKEYAELYKGRQKILEEMVYETIVNRVVQKQMKPIIEDSITKRALLVNRPQITFGFNLRHPLELLLYEKLMESMAVEMRKVCEQSIQQEAVERRQLFIIDQWIEEYGLLQPLLEQIANQLLEENIGEYVVESILSRVVRQAAFVVAESGYNKAVNDWFMKTVESIKEDLQQAVLQQAFAEALIEMGYGLEKLQQKGSLL